RRRRSRQRDESARRQDPVSALTLATVELHIAVAHQVEIADLCCRRLVERYRAVDTEVHPAPPAGIDQLHLFDLADLDAVGADELPVAQPAAIAELSGVGVGGVEAHLTEHHDDGHGDQQQHQRDDAEFDGVAGAVVHGLIVLSPTWRPHTYSIAYGEPV